MPTLVKMPKWGLTMTTGTVTEWIAAEGQEIASGAPLLTVETEKAVNDVEAPAGGILRKIVAEAGSEVPVSGPVAVIAATDEALTDEEIATLISEAAIAAETASAASSDSKPARPSQPATRDESGRVNASPAARKRAKELGIELAAVAATGPGGRITSEDVEAAASESDTANGAVHEDFVTLTGGQRLFSLQAGPASGGPPLVFLHGLGGSHATWLNLLSAIADRYRVIALDLPGHGQSDKPDPAESDYSVAGMATLVAEAIASTTKDPVMLVGHSLGGAVAIKIALERPELVSGLVLIDSAGLGNEISGDLLDRVEAEPSEDEARKLLELFYQDGSLVRDRGVTEMYEARTAPGANAALRAAAEASFTRKGQRIGLRPQLRKIAVPTLVIWGEHDQVIPASHANGILRTIPGVWIEIIEGVGHVPQIEAVEAVEQLLVQFTRSFPAPSAV